MKKLFVVIPCYKVTRHILGVLEGVGPEVHGVVVVDDCCPDASGEFVSENCSDSRVVVIKNEVNKGVGGAVVAGYKHALGLGADICIKVDGDGQMDPSLIPALVSPILAGVADYVKGNRFYSLYNVSSMPSLRLFGNTVLSFMTKVSSGYWGIFDPTNGFTAIHRTALERLNLDCLHERYFFETDILIELGGIRARVVDMPMVAKYEDEESGLKVRDILGLFLRRHLKAIVRRIVYQYYLRDFSVASLQLPLGLLMFVFGLIYGGGAWIESSETGVPATAGTVILSALPLLLGVQFLLAFLSEDISSEPREPLQRFSID